MAEERLTVDELAAEWRLSKASIYRLMESGRLGYIPVTARRRLIARSQIEAYLEATKVEAAS